MKVKPDYLSWREVLEILDGECPTIMQHYNDGKSWNFIDVLIKFGVLEDNKEYRHTTGGEDFATYPPSQNHTLFYEYIKSKPMYQLHMI